MLQKDFVTLYCEWLATTFRILRGETVTRGDIFEEYSAFEERLKKEAAPSVVLPLLAKVAVREPSLATAIQEGFFAWLLERKVLRPVDPRILKKRGRPRSIKAHSPDDSAVIGRPVGRPKTWDRTTLIRLAELVNEVKQNDLDPNGLPIRHDRIAIQKLLRDQAKHDGKRTPTAREMRPTVELWRKRLADARKLLRSGVTKSAN